MEFRELMQAKGGGRVPLETFFDAPRKAGAKAGLVFNFEKITRAPNSLLSHCLLLLAPKPDREALLESIYAAYFEYGQDIGRLDVLVEIGSLHGLKPELVQDALNGLAGREQVLGDHRWAAEHGIQGVPFYVINQRYGISGAQPPEALTAMFDEIVRKET
jgi:predicted DsbA family dithiol-disulfide isomerase